TGRLDVLVNNAGVITVRPRQTGDGLESTFAINQPSALARDQDAAARLWTLSEQLTGVEPWDHSD
ncbi:hypothetical protein ACFQ07_28950, partial [Actinomadura adrarensis]